MTERELLEQVARRLREANIPFMVVGSVASSYHGEPRVTHDIDLVVDSSLERLLQFVDSFEPPFYVSDVAARQAFARHSLFNVIHPDCEYKADIIVRKNQDFDREEFARRRPASIWGVEVDVATPEDVVLAKLQWARRTDSQQQLRDATMVAVVQGANLDLPYLHKWAVALGLEGLLSRVFDERPAD